MNLAELLELTGILVVLAGIAWLLGVLLPSPYGWPCALIVFGLGLIPNAYLAKRNAKKPRGVDVE